MLGRFICPIDSREGVLSEIILLESNAAEPIASKNLPDRRETKSRWGSVRVSETRS